MMVSNATRVKEAESDWVRAHEALSRLARERAAADAEEGRWLLAALRSAVHVHVGFGSFGEYVERLFGYKPRSTQEKLRVAEALEELPNLAHALSTGSLGWSAVRELTRVAVADTEQAWLELARGKTVRQLEELVASKNPGDEPSAPSPAPVRPRVLRFEVAPETFALFREAILSLRRRSPDRLDDDAALLSMARHVLGERREEGRASYQIALTVCSACGTGQQQAGGELVAVGADVVAMAHCDAQHLGQFTLAANENALPDRAQTDAITSADEHTGDAPTHEMSRDERAHAGARTESVDSGASEANPSARLPRPDARVGARATQTIPPALRRAALVRDQHCCRVPGCKNAAYLDLHHIVPRSEGGRNVLINIITLCGAHHRAVHRGALSIEMDAALGFRFRHGDGTAYGQVLEPQALDVQAKIFSALRRLGFGEGEVHAVLRELRLDENLRECRIEHLLREALRRMRVRARAR